MDVIAQACRLFNQNRTGSSPAQYIFARPRQGSVYVGLGWHQKIFYRRGGFEIIYEGGDATLVPCEGDPFVELRQLLAPGYPSFWMVSPDIGRVVQDPDLPLIVCVQPKFELVFQAFGGAGFLPRPLSVLPAEGWETQSDQVFLERLQEAIRRLQDYPQGKMILTRQYQRKCGFRDPLSLFSLFAASEPLAACSHYLQIDEGIASLGCSPENVFEIRGDRLIFDVVAGTRGISTDPVTDARWLAALQSDPKERREHLMAFERYKSRISNLTVPASVRAERELEVLQLGNVRHLYSSLSGTLADGRDWLSLLAESFPALTSYPDALKTFADNPDEALRYYGGILGRVSSNGQDAGFFLNLRAALVKRDTLFTQGGVGVIADSEPGKELLEVKNKLSGLFKAVGAWEAQP